MLIISEERMFTEALHTLQTPSVFCLSIIKLYICDIESFNLMEMNGKRIFKVSKSKSVRILTVGAWVIVVTICLFILWQGIKHPVALLITVPILAIVISVLVYYHRQSPQYIELTDDALVLHCMTGYKVFRYEDIAEVSKWQGKPSRLLRQWGSGGFGGYIGWFSGGGLGSQEAILSM